MYITVNSKYLKMHKTQLLKKKIKIPPSKKKKKLKGKTVL